MIETLLLLFLPVQSVEIGDKVTMVWKYGVVEECRVEYGLVGLQARDWKVTWRNDDDTPAFTTIDKNVYLFWKR